MQKLNVLTLLPRYIPGFKGGGPIQTLCNMVEQLGDNFNFKIITSDRDSGDSQAYWNINADTWNTVGKAQVYYCSPSRQTFKNIKELVNKTNHDILYLNSFFNNIYTIIPLLLRKFGFIPRKPLIIAPRGEFSPGALELKKVKKTLYINLVKSLNLYKNVVWQASSKYEREDIRSVMGENNTILIAPNIPAPLTLKNTNNSVCDKKDGELKVIFLSRITPKKNLDFALKTLQKIKGKLFFNIYGTIENKSYWKKCLKLIKTMPDNIYISYSGEVPHENVSDKMNENDLFFLPTMGENFGHVIIEALGCGCPVLISDQTPWKNLSENKAGWELSIDDISTYRKIIEQLIAMNSSEFKQFSQGARQYAKNIIKDSRSVERNRELFQRAWRG